MSLHAMNRRTFLETATTVTAATLLTSQPWLGRRRTQNRKGWRAALHRARPDER